MVERSNWKRNHIPFVKKWWTKANITFLYAHPTTQKNLLFPLHYCYSIPLFLCVLFVNHDHHLLQMEVLFRIFFVLQLYKYRETDVRFTLTSLFQNVRRKSALQLMIPFGFSIAYFMLIIFSCMPFIFNFRSPFRLRRVFLKVFFLSRWQS